MNFTGSHSQNLGCNFSGTAGAEQQLDLAIAAVPAGSPASSSKGSEPLPRWNTLQDPGRAGGRYSWQQLVRDRDGRDASTLWQPSRRAPALSPQVRREVHGPWHLEGSH